MRTTMQQKKDNNLVFFCLNCPMTINKEGRVKIHNNNRNIVQMYINYISVTQIQYQFNADAELQT